MDRYCLQILNFGTWEDEKSFRYPHQAIEFGKETYSQNQWRVYRIDNGETVHEYDPMAVIENEARLDTQRMADTVRWREVFQNRNNAAIDAAARQRETDRQRTQARRDRLRGFNFVGNRPQVPNDDLFEEIVGRPNPSWVRHADFGANFGSKKHSFEDFKIDWRKEGF